MEEYLFIGISTGVSEKGNNFYILQLGRQFSDPKYGIGFYPISMFISKEEFSDFKDLTPTSIVNAVVKSVTSDSPDASGKKKRSYVLCNYRI